MQRRRRAMSPDHARDVKTAGHRNERDFASLIGGELNQVSHVDKTDVIDAQGRAHSVKAGNWCQVFLYGRERLVTNTYFQELGQVGNLMVACLDSYPATYEDYIADKETAKANLQPNMRRLCAELTRPGVFSAFLEKALFDIGDADYLSIFPGPAKANRDAKVFHIFDKSDVVAALAADIEVQNSKKRGSGQMDDQKVTFRSNHHRRNVGELEDRHDSPLHYRQMKFRLNVRDTYRILSASIPDQEQIAAQLVTYGRAVDLFQLSRG